MRFWFSKRRIGQNIKIKKDSFKTEYKWKIFTRKTKNTIVTIGEQRSVTRAVKSTQKKEWKLHCKTIS